MRSQAVLADSQTSCTVVTNSELEACIQEFARLISKRNALIHAHPITDHDGSQILNHQARVDHPLPDMKWPAGEVEAVIAEFDVAACAANELLQRLLK